MHLYESQHPIHDPDIGGEKNGEEPSRFLTTTYLHKQRSRCSSDWLGIRAILPVAEESTVQEAFLMDEHQTNVEASCSKFPRKKLESNQHQLV